jgi:hypothetical protein
MTCVPRANRRRAIRSSPGLLLLALLLAGASGSWRPASALAAGWQIWLDGGEAAPGARGDAVTQAPAVAAAGRAVSPGAREASLGTHAAAACEQDVSLGVRGVSRGAQDASVGSRSMIGARNVSLGARAYEAGGVLMLDVAALAASLGLEVRVRAATVLVRDGLGRDWSCPPGGSLLRGEGRGTTLAQPLRLAGRAVFLPAAVAADLAGWSLDVNEAAGVARLTPQPGKALRPKAPGRLAPASHGDALPGRQALPPRPPPMPPSAGVPARYAALATGPPEALPAVFPDSMAKRAATLPSPAPSTAPPNLLSSPVATGLPRDPLADIAATGSPSDPFWSAGTDPPPAEQAPPGGPAIPSVPAPPPAAEAAPAAPAPALPPIPPFPSLPPLPPLQATPPTSAPKAPPPDAAPPAASAGNGARAVPPSPAMPAGAAVPAGVAAGGKAVVGGPAPAGPGGLADAADSAASSDLGAPAGWRMVSVPKPPGVLAADAGILGGDKPLPDILPPEHDTLRVGVSVGHIVGADSAAEMDVAGEFAGREVRAYGVGTEGPAGVQLQNGYAGIDRPDGWGAEGGNLPSDIWGLANGVRYINQPLFGGRPSLGLFFPTSASGLTHEVVDAADDIAISRYAALGGELASDGSWLVRGRYHGDSFGLFAFDRQATGVLGPAMGVSGYVNLPANFALQGGYDKSGSGLLAIASNDAALRIPLLRFGDVTLSSSGVNTFDVRLRENEARLDLGWGPWLARAAYQDEQGSIGLLGEVRSPFGQRQLLASLAYLASSRVRLEATAVYRTPDLGPVQSWQQLAASLRIFSRTALGVVAMTPGSPVHDPLHLFLEQGLPNDFTIYAEAGRMPTFQGLGALDEPVRFKITVRKVFRVPTPPGGGEVRGQVTGAGTPVGEGVPVELGRYRTSTDADGGFLFHNVPPGSYSVGVPAPSVPAAFAGAPPAQKVAVTSREKNQVELPLVPLGTVSGRVFVDRRGDGTEDPAAVAIGIVVRLDDEVTATGRDGSFAFHAVQPGTHQLSVDASRLPHGLLVTIPSQIAVGLPAGASLDGIKFRLVPRPRPVILEPVGR